jgi:hypothetical protein
VRAMERDPWAARISDCGLKIMMALPRIPPFVDYGFVL